MIPKKLPFLFCKHIHHNNQIYFMFVIVIILFHNLGSILGISKILSHFMTNNNPLTAFHPRKYTFNIINQYSRILSIISFSFTDCLRDTSTLVPSFKITSNPPLNHVSTFSIHRRLTMCFLLARKKYFSLKRSVSALSDFKMSGRDSLK